MIVVHPDPRLEQLRRLDNWLSRLKVWRQNLLATPFAPITAGLTVWLNSAVPLANPKLFFLISPAVPKGNGRSIGQDPGSWRVHVSSQGVGFRESSRRR
jgi:hypothetical protein